MTYFSLDMFLELVPLDKFLELVRDSVWGTLSACEALKVAVSQYFLKFFYFINPIHPGP